MSKQIISGRIDKVFTKDFGEEDRFGNQYAVNINVGGQWYGLGKKKKPAANVKVNGNWHQLSEGDVIEAVAETVERNGRTYTNVKTSDITVKEFGSGGNNSNVATSSSGVNNRSVSPQVSNDDRQKAIMRQSAMGYAANVVAATLTSKSNLEDAAQKVVEIADNYFLPYAEYGLTGDEMRQKENEQQNLAAAAADDDNGEPFDDDLPF
jgi:hypothetical protein